MNKEAKQNLISKIWRTIRQRNQIRSLFLDDGDNYTSAGLALMTLLAKFCYLNKTTTKVSKISGKIDPIASAVAEGRREVILRIIELLRFTDERALKMIEALNQQPED